MILNRKDHPLSIVDNDTHDNTRELHYVLTSEGAVPGDVFYQLSDTPGDGPDRYDIYRVAHVDPPEDATHEEVDAAWIGAEEVDSCYSRMALQRLLTRACWGGI